MGVYGVSLHFCFTRWIDFDVEYVWRKAILGYMGIKIGGGRKRSQILSSLMRISSKASGLSGLAPLKEGLADKLS